MVKASFYQSDLIKTQFMFIYDFISNFYEDFVEKALPGDIGISQVLLQRLSKRSKGHYIKAYFGLLPSQFGTI